MPLDVSQFDYQLPANLIAAHPSPDRGGSRLLVIRNDTEAREEVPFRQLGDLLLPGDLLVANDTRVLPARLQARKPTGGKVEIMLERLLDADVALVQLRTSKTVRPEQVLEVGDCELRVIDRSGGFFSIRSVDGSDLERVFQDHGTVPLPPYIERQPQSEDSDRYQTVYARHPGAVAAPTAGLHFDRALIDSLVASGIGWDTITLHVGAGTFQPVRGDRVEEHRMHRERIEITADTCNRINETRANGGRVVAVGTTVVRALESAARDGRVEPFQGDSNLFIYPGYRFQVVDALITNFHLPRSTLLMMVSAFAGYERVMGAYRYAIDNQFRFYSYGDAMFLQREKQ